QPDREEKRVTGEEREQEPALDEDDDQADPDELGVELLEQPMRVHPGDAEEQWLEETGHAGEPIQGSCESRQSSRASPRPGRRGTSGLASPTWTTARASWPPRGLPVTWCADPRWP